MKTTTIYLVLALSASLVSFSGVFAQETRTITLSVDIDRLNNGNPSMACSFNADSNTQVLDDSSPENFTILVNEEDTIIWEAYSTGGDEIDIESIQFEEVRGRKGLFREPKLNGIGSNGKKKAKGKINKRTKGNEYKYAIEFSVDGEFFLIDPKIKGGA